MGTLYSNGVPLKKTVQLMVSLRSHFYAVNNTVVHEL